ncbi:signal peptidase II [Treponema endosymbiont of Eucomonympha sp.]|uniref:signal peptidase II n=2 Tax=Treponema endosymbiont of Eucomonympha sp. TaxID=1580831 RepID=UPI000751155A|nr:signal peptidase II [Treponema endosymbiont of Eucomonympha sp.]
MNVLQERKKHIALTLGTVFANYAVDRVTKLAACAFLKGREDISLLHNVMVLMYRENSGAFLSLGAEWNAALKYVALLVAPLLLCIAGTVYLMLKEKNLQRIVLCACVIGGGVGNLFDRLLNGFNVIDFMNFGIGRLRTGVLNFADLSVTAGAVLLLFSELREAKKQLAPANAGNPLDDTSSLSADDGSPSND